MPKQLTETRLAPLTEAAGDVTEKGIVPLEFITPGWGSSGYYPAKVLENAAKDKVFPAGTQMFLDHPAASESYDRPERSVRDLIAVFSTDATWNGTGLVAEAQVFGPYRDLFRDENFVKSVGVSIRASAQVTAGEAEGRKGVIITELVEADSVDFVTKAGRGGRVLAVLESARATAVEAQREATEAMSNDTRDLLSVAIRNAHAVPGTAYAYLRDFDPDTSEAVYGVETETDSHLYRDGFTVADDGLSVTLAGSPVEVRPRTDYVPLTSSGITEAGWPPGTVWLDPEYDVNRVLERMLAAVPLDATTPEGRAVAAWANEAAPLVASPNVPAPAGRTTHPLTSKEDTIMGLIQVDEAEHRRATEAAGRVAEAEATAARLTRENALLRARETARPIAAEVATSESLPAPTQARVAREALAGLTVDEAGAFDEAAFRAAVEAARTAAETEVAAIAESLGAGKVTGFGRTTAVESAGGAIPTWDDIDAHLDTPKEA